MSGVLPETNLSDPAIGPNSLGVAAWHIPSRHFGAPVNRVTRAEVDRATGRKAEPVNAGGGRHFSPSSVSPLRTQSREGSKASVAGCFYALGGAQRSRGILIGSTKAVSSLGSATGTVI